MTVEQFFKNVGEYWDAPDSQHMTEFQPEADCMDGVVAGVSKAWASVDAYCKNKGMSHDDMERFADKLIVEVLKKGEF